MKKGELKNVQNQKFLPTCNTLKNRNDEIEFTISLFNCYFY